MRYCDTFGARRPPSPEALPSDPPFHEKARSPAVIITIITQSDQVTGQPPSHEACSMAGDWTAEFFHERLGLMGGLGRMAAGGRQTCHSTVC